MQRSLDDVLEEERTDKLASDFEDDDEEESSAELYSSSYDKLMDQAHPSSDTDVDIAELYDEEDDEEDEGSDASLLEAWSHQIELSELV